MTLLHDTAEIIKSEGFTGAHSFIFLTRYAFLCGDKQLLSVIGNTLKDMDFMEPDAMLAYAYAEYCESQGEGASEFASGAADYILASCPRSDRALALAYVKCARVFGREDYLAEAHSLLSDSSSGAKNGAFTALAFIEMYRATFNRDYLLTACALSDVIEKNFNSIFRPDDVYDLSQPSMNSAVAVMYDELARMTQEKDRLEISEKHKRLVKKLAEKYPSKVSFGLCALLSDEYEWKTVVCRFCGYEPPESLLKVISFYSPLTEVIAEPGSDVAAPEFYFMKNGVLEQIHGI